MQKGQLSARWARKLGAISGPLQEHAFHWPYHYCMHDECGQDKEVAQTPQRRPQRILFQGLCLCGVAPAALRDCNEQARHVGRTRCCCCCGGTTYTLGTMECLGRVCRRCHASARAFSCLAAECETRRIIALSRRITAAAVSPCTLSTHSLEKQAMYHSLAIPVRESCIPCVDKAVLAARHTSHNQTGGGWTGCAPPCARCTHGQGCLVGAAIAKSFLFPRACACMPPCVSRWH